MRGAVRGLPPPPSRTHISRSQGPLSVHLLNLEAEGAGGEGDGAGDRLDHRDVRRARMVLHNVIRPAVVNMEHPQPTPELRFQSCIAIAAMTALPDPRASDPSGQRDAAVERPQDKREPDRRKRKREPVAPHEGSRPQSPHGGRCRYELAGFAAWKGEVLAGQPQGSNYCKSGNYIALCV